MQETQVWSLVGELRSHTLCDAAKKEKTNKANILRFDPEPNCTYDRAWHMGAMQSRLPWCTAPGAPFIFILRGAPAVPFIWKTMWTGPLESGNSATTFNIFCWWIDEWMNERNLGWPCSGLSPLIPKVLLFTKILFRNIDWMASASRLILFPRLAAFRLRNVIACFNFRTGSTPASNSSGLVACAPLPSLCHSCLIPPVHFCSWTVKAPVSVVLDSLLLMEK